MKKIINKHVTGYELLTGKLSVWGFSAHSFPRTEMNVVIHATCPSLLSNFNKI
jgi:hypothetical protein